MTTQLWADSRCEGHLAGPMHPESPGRLRAIADVLKRAPISGTVARTPRPATREELTAVHDPAHVEAVLSLAGRSAQLDPDTAMSPGSADAALLAAGGAAQAVTDVLAGVATNAFVLVRPPGHHAERDRAMGFCLFNNVAVAAEVALRQGASRVLVLDWDVHHGNGTQHTFETRRDVLFLSSHQFPYYPGTGAPEEDGIGPGKGFTVNVALPGGQGDADYGAVFHDVFLPAAQRFRPDLILVSAGFDPHRADPIGGMDVTERGFAAMTSVMKQLAHEVCGAKLVLLLEGGYDLNGLAQSVHACVEVLAGGRTPSLLARLRGPERPSPPRSRCMTASLAWGAERNACHGKIPNHRNRKARWLAASASLIVRPMSLLQLVSALNWCMTLVVGALFALVFVVAPKLPFEALLAIAVVLVTLGGLHAYLAISIEKYRGRALQTIVGGLSLLNFPIGTIYGALALYVCWFADSAKRFDDPEAWAKRTSDEAPAALEFPRLRRDESAYAYAKRLDHEGFAVNEIEQALGEAGFDADDVETTVGALERAREPRGRSRAGR